MSASQRRKGATYERTVANKFRTVVPEAKRGIGQARGGGAEVADVVIPHLHIEAKHRATQSLYAALKQAASDCAPGKLPCAVVRINRRPDVIAFELDRFVATFGEFLAWHAQRARTAGCGLCQGKGTRQRVRVLVGGGESIEMVACACMEPTP